MLTITIIKALLLPPATQILFLFIGFLFWRVNRKVALLSFITGFASLWALSSPVISQSLFHWLEKPYIANTSSNNAPAKVEAIVVLGGGVDHYLTHSGHVKSTVSHQTLWRLRHAAFLANHWKVPVIVSGGGRFQKGHDSVAQLSKDILTNEFGVYPVWVEGSSRNTWENAHLTQKLLSLKGVQKVGVVTHAYHMRRSSYSFSRAGIEHIPLATGFISNNARFLWWQHWLPSSSALMDSRTALHEYLGLLFYRMK